jgi:hypothetical protein
VRGGCRLRSIAFITGSAFSEEDDVAPGIRLETKDSVGG